ncbi:MAG: oxidoreductase [Syntrophomonadaceae bacterium]|nr:oxidoreductase [Syntrophomonadaceae bacterium]
MNELIKVTYNNDRPTVLGRDLHSFLVVDTEYRHWFPRMCEYGFTEGVDFRSFLNESTGGRPAQDHQLTIDMAKEISMLQRTEKGKLARLYFIDLEKKWNSPEAVMARALQMANRKILDLQNRIELDKPKTIFADAVTASKSSILIGDLAKILRQNGYDIGQNRLFMYLRQNGYLIKSGASRNMPTQRSMDMSLFEIKETTLSNPDGSIRITKTPKVTGKGQVYFINHFLRMEVEIG